MARDESDFLQSKGKSVVQQWVFLEGIAGGKGTTIKVDDQQSSETPENQRKLFDDPASKDASLQSGVPAQGWRY